MYNKILICNDGSPLSKRAVAHAFKLAKLMGSEVLILKVIPRVIESHFDGAMALRPTEISRIEKSWAKAAHNIVDEDQAKAQKLGLKAESMVAKSDIVYKAIIDVAVKKKADLIVMASHGRNGIQKLILGSETQNVLTHTQIPVLVLR
jgi:nucleotide-binding universal stress UspA family protein